MSKLFLFLCSIQAAPRKFLRMVFLVKIFQDSVTELVILRMKPELKELQMKAKSAQIHFPDTKTLTH